MLASNLIALAASVAAGLVAWRCWHLVREEARGHGGRLVEAGEGRTRFLAACGMMLSAAFFAASAFNLGAFLALPLCR
ncbi:MAG: hypothetical protein IRY94_13475 [Rhodospirillaceae bacterium]|nr:hypothetical protein [Rhodospirillaceae bacterium]